MGRRRAHPVVGGRVRLSSLAAVHHATIEQVDDGGRRVVVVTDGGERRAFVLSRGTGLFVEEGVRSGARLTFEED